MKNDSRKRVDILLSYLGQVQESPQKCLSSSPTRQVKPPGEAPKVKVKPPKVKPPKIEYVLGECFHNLMLDNTCSNGPS